MKLKRKSYCFLINNKISYVSAFSKEDAEESVALHYPDTDIKYKGEVEDKFFIKKLADKNNDEHQYTLTSSFYRYLVKMLLRQDESLLPLLRKESWKEAAVEAENRIMSMKKGDTLYNGDLTIKEALDSYYYKIKYTEVENVD